MRRSKVSRFGVVAFLVLAGPALAGAAKGKKKDKPREAVVSVPIPGGAAGIGFDDLRYSKGLDRILAPAGRTGTLALIDPSTRAVTTIGGFSAKDAFGGGHGDGVTSADEGKGWIYAADRDSLLLHVVDPAAGKSVASATLAFTPDYVRYVESTNEIWVTEPESEQIEIFRLEGDKPPRPVSTAVIHVPGGPESIVFERSRGHAYTNTFTGATLAINVKSRLIVQIWSNGCTGSRGIAQDELRGFVFVGCAEGKAAVLGSLTGTSRGTLPTGAGVDGIDYDANLAHLYVPGGKSATLSVLGVSPDGSLTLLGTLPTAAGSRCLASDQKGTIFVADPAKGRVLVLKDPFPSSTK